MTLLRTCLLSTSVLAIGLASLPVHAELVARTSHFNAPAVCQAARTVYDAQLRKRPLGIQNEGTTDAYVTCALIAEDNIDAVEVYMSTIDGTENPVTCTLVSNYNLGDNEFITKTVETVDGDFSGTVFLPEDFIDQEETFPTSFLSLSCNLGPGTGLNDIWIRYREEIGT